jgi:hypothetical protein
MKTPGVPWLGEVPAHWAVLPNCVIFTEAKDRDYPDEPALEGVILDMLSDHTEF